MASVEPDSNEEVITRQILKSRSGEFDVESIHTLSLKKAGIVDLGCIGECASLERLDLSYNSISRLHKLAGLITLTRLNLSANRITSLEGLQSLENLQNLNLCGNLIGSLDALRCISGLDKLISLRLQDQTSGLTNPMCNTSYVGQVFIMLPMLHTLDGQRIRGRGSELFQLCQDMDKALTNLPSVKTSYCEAPSQDLVTAQQWVVDVTKQDKVVEAEEQLQAMLASCKVLSQQASQALTDAQLSQTFKSSPGS